LQIEEIPMTYGLFTEASREVARLANEEALSFGKDTHIETHHLLLGVLKVGGPEADMLVAHGITLRRVREITERMGECGDYQDRRGKLPMAESAKSVIERSLEEAQPSGAQLVEPGHLVLALLEEQEGVAAKVFREVAVDSVAIRDELLASWRADPGR
jgi:ATP-dependent Clp protease ATP-binding subunit ClpC